MIFFVQLLVVQSDGETEFEKKAREGMDLDEAQFSVELNLEQQSFMWSDKYRPRKPRFFNRVHTVSFLLIISTVRLFFVFFLDLVEVFNPKTSVFLFFLF